MAPTTVAIDQTTATPDPIRTVRELSVLGFGHPTTIRSRIHEENVPTEVLDGRGTVGVRESNLHLLRKPVRVPTMPTMPAPASAPTPAARVDDMGDLAAMAARMVATWPRLSDDRKRELGALLATP